VDANGNQYGAAYGVCLDQFNTTISTTSGGTTTTTPRTVVRVSGDYISSHDGSSTTLLLAESILTPPGITDVTTNSGQTPFLNLVVQPAGTTCYYRPGSYWTSSFYLATANSAELNLGFEWGPAPTSGYTPPLVTNKITSRHSGGCNVSFCDGHNYFLRDSIDSRVFCQLMTPWGTQAGQTSTYGYVPFNEGSY
jgi:prepilin-type processing-associated H-X9-DG protein